MFMVAPPPGTGRMPFVPGATVTSRPSTASSVGPTCTLAGHPTECKWGIHCYNWDPEHRRRFSHPEPEEGPAGCQRRACKYGAGCYQRSPAHLEQFVHPGDRNYRSGLVIFSPGQRPEFESLWQLFQFHDPDESGHLSFAEFSEALGSCEVLAPGRTPEREQAWQDADGPRLGYVNFRQFVTWTREFLGLEYPLGLEAAGSSRPCRFRFTSLDGTRCSCPEYQPAADSSLCVCGHKRSMHRSDFAQRTLSKFLEDRTGNAHWAPGEEGLVPVADEEVLSKLQDTLTATRKLTDNWTRDRGCLLHGVNGCSPSCASKNRCPVPKGYTLVAAYRNQNQDLWQKYSLVKTAITEDCSRQQEALRVEPVSVTTSGRDFEGAELDAACNEWHLFHGSSVERCRGICSTNFRLALAGTGATWKDAGKATGTPLYGFGIYLAESITKADEYARALPSDEPLRPEGLDEELHCVVLCRVLGGRTRVVTTNEFEIDKLRTDVFEGPYNSVFGDRVSTLGKPFREVVVYDKDQCFPEFLLVYTRAFD